MIEKFEIMITPFQCMRTIHVYLPDNYNESQEQYPVIYMFDGHNLFSDYDATYGKSLNMEKFLNQYSQKMIVVGIECNHEENRRLIEYCPYYVNHSLLGEIKGEGDQLIKWIVYELKPYIDEHYRTDISRDATMIAGCSMGGLMALYAVSCYNRYFSKAACLSPSIGVGFELLKKDAQDSQMDENTKIFMSWGSDESRNKTGLAYATSRYLELSYLYTNKNVKTYPYLYVHGKHNEESWGQQLQIFMDYLWN